MRKHTERRRRKKEKEMENSIKCGREQVEEEPRDTYKVAYVLHFVLGAGNLLPWNTLITGVDYFSYIYPGRHVEKVFSVAYMVSSVLVLVAMLYWRKWSQRVSFRLRMNLGFSLFVLSLMATPTVDWMHKGSSAAAYNVVVASVVVCGLADGLIGGSLIGSAGKMPKQYMQAVFAGTASSGVLISVSRIITKASLPHTPEGLRTSAHFYFIVSAITLMGCLLCCNFLCKLPLMQQHDRLLEEYISYSRLKFWEVTRTIQWPALGIFLIYTVTLSIFPGFLAEDIKSRLLKDWYPIVLITVYNFSDFLGKSVTAMYVMNDIRKATWGCVARLLFYPMFSACLHGPKWLKTEAPVVVLTIALGLTNGYLTSAIMILAPKSVPLPEAEIAAIVMAVFLGLGLVSGSVIGWLWII